MMNMHTDYIDDKLDDDDDDDDGDDGGGGWQCAWSHSGSEV